MEYSANTVPDGGHQGPADAIFRCDASQGTENKRMMGNNEITFFFKCLMNQFFRAIQTNENAHAFCIGVACYQSAIVIFFLIFRRRKGFQVMNNIMIFICQIKSFQILIRETISFYGISLQAEYTDMRYGLWVMSNDFIIHNP